MVSSSRRAVAAPRTDGTKRPRCTRALCYGRLVTTTDTNPVETVRDILDAELSADYTGIWKIAWHLRRLAPFASDTAIREMGETVLRQLVESGAIIGDMNGTGEFDPWHCLDGVGRAMRAWETLGHDPEIGEVAWLVRFS